jgi:nucleoside-diphosphate-sugar epimerase
MLRQARCAAVAALVVLMGQPPAYAALACRHVTVTDAAGASAVRTVAARIGFANGLALDEQHVSFAAARAGMPIVIVSPTLPIGPGDRSLTPPTRMVLDFVNAAPPVFADFELNMIHVHDVALGQVRAAEHPGSVMILLATPDASPTFFR